MQEKFVKSQWLGWLTKYVKKSLSFEFDLHERLTQNTLNNVLYKPRKKDKLLIASYDESTLKTEH